MTDTLVWLMNFVSPANAAISPVAEEAAEPIKIGFIVLAVIIGPVILLTLASMLEKPRTFRVPGLFVASFVSLISMLILSFLAISLVLGFIVPG